MSNCADESAKRPGDPALASDHLADVVGSNLESQHDHVALVDALDPDGVRIVDEPTGDPGEQVVHAVYWIPAALISRATGSDG